jgi:protein TonB
MRFSLNTFMKKLIPFLITIAFFTINTSAQESPQTDPFTHIEYEDPYFPGGTNEMFAFIAKNLQYPPIEAHIEGTVILRFLIKPDGEITDIKVVKDIGGGLAQEAIRVVKLMPKWINNRHRETNYTLPIKFKLE